jgi:hypothetical protein
MQKAWRTRGEPETPQCGSSNFQSTELDFGGPGLDLFSHLIQTRPKIADKKTGCIH